MNHFYFGSSSERRKLSGQGKIRKIYTGVYTAIMDDNELAKAMRYEWPLIVANGFKKAVISYRSALEFKPSPMGYIFLVAKQSKEVEIGGVTFKLIRGTPTSHSNQSALMGARAACPERAFLDLLISSKIQVRDDRYISAEELEDRLETMMMQSGEEFLNSFREKCREISIELSMPSSYKKLDGIIGTLLGSKNVNLHGKRSISRALGLAFDDKKLELFLALANYLEGVDYPSILDVNFTNTEHFKNKAFFESYFSNYIEGTDFAIEEAEEIIFDNREIENRANDSHDIFGTYEIVSNQKIMLSPSTSFADFIADLKKINKTIIPTRLDKKPGEFKTKVNKAGNTIFVHPDYVIGTLKKAFEISETISHAISKSIFLSFVVAEVHPFTDGNGRTSRIILNRELLFAGYASIIIPTVYREDYIGALRSLSRKGRPAPIVTMLLRALKFSHLDFSDYQSIKKELTDRNWFVEPSEGKIVE